MNEFEKTRYTRQEDFNINEKALIDFDFDGVKKKVYGNVNLSIFVDDYCNADCKFCVAQLRYENMAMAYQKPKIEDDEEYYRRLDEILTYIAPLNVSVSITGGEPTLSPRFQKILEIIDKHNIRKRTITTNGSALLKKIDGNKTNLDLLIDYKFDHLNISKAHFDETINQNIMRYHKGYCSNKDLVQIIPYALKHGLRPRLSCLLLKDGIHDVDGMVKYIEYYEKLGIDNIIFRELMDYDENTMCNREKMDYNLRNKVKLNDVWKNIDKDSRFIPYKNLLGYYYYVEMYDYHNVRICSESADLRVQTKEKEENSNVVYEMVFHPNGNLNGSWVDNEDILLKYEEKNS